MKGPGSFFVLVDVGILYYGYKVLYNIKLLAIKNGVNLKILLLELINFSHSLFMTEKKVA
jgi:hypothetical protein